MEITHFDILRGQYVSVHPGPATNAPPIRVAGRYIWPDGELDSGLIDWGDDIRDTPGVKEG
jgi:hypothetical protein